MEWTAWKTNGNLLYQSKDYNEAIKFYQTALELSKEDPSAAISSIYFNISLCYSSLGVITDSILYCKKAVLCDKKYEKAYFRLIKGLLECQRFQEARLFLLKSFKECGETKELKTLEIEYNKLSHGFILRPSPNAFEVLDDELGDGNFSKIYKVANKTPDKTIFAMKVMEKPTIEKTRRRHPNVDNEILMEKKVLSRLSHPNIIPLFASFQDQYTLYLQMEFVPGGELWSVLHDTLMGHRAQVGLPTSNAAFVFAELLNAVEHMHSRGVIHRDLKPENILITQSGHIKVIDFGTAKDILQTDLNGPDFVGTAEYMCPSTVNSDPSGVESDLWALGIILFQILFGYTPFTAQSPYLTFLRIKKAIVRLPACTPDGVCELLNILLEPNSAARFRKATSDQPNLVYEDYLGCKQVSLSDMSDTLKTESDATTAITSSTTSSSTTTQLDTIQAKFDQEKSVLVTGTHASSSAVSSTITVDKSTKKRNRIYYPPNYDILRSNPFFNLIPDTRSLGVCPEEMSVRSECIDWLTAHFLTTNDPVYDSVADRITITTATTATATTTNATATTTTTASTTATATATATTATTATTAAATATTECSLELANSDRIEFLRTTHQRQAVNIEKLSEMCIKVVAEVCIKLIEESALLGGSRPDVEWMQHFDLLKLPDMKRQQIAHYLNRHNRLHNPSINRLFYPSAVDSRCRRADLHSREYVGYTQATQGQFEHPFGFALLTEPALSIKSDDVAANAVSNSNIAEDTLKSVISALNKLRPKFIVTIGNMTTYTPESKLYSEGIDTYRRMMARVLDTIPCLYVPGSIDVGYPNITESSLNAYRNLFGAEYYGFWYGGTRLLVINSSLLIISEDSLSSEWVRSQRKAQEDWFNEEIEQAKLSAQNILVFSYHCWIEQKEASLFNIDSGQVVPTHIRDIWLPKLRHTKFKFILSTCSTEASNVRRGIYSFSESEPEPNESQPGEEEKLLENVNRDYEGPYHILTPSFTHAVDPDIDLEGSDCHQKSNTILDGDDCIDIEYDAVPTTIKPSGAVCGKGIRIVQVVEGDITQSFYNISKLPTRSILKW